MLKQTQDQQQERRLDDAECEFWDKLTMAQKFAVSSLNQFGYQLAFVRGQDDDRLAVLLCDEKAATIDAEGTVNISPLITIRH